MQIIFSLIWKERRRKEETNNYKRKQIVCEENWFKRIRINFGRINLVHSLPV